MINGKKKASLSMSDHIKIIYVIILQINKRLEVQQMINEIEKKERLLGIRWIYERNTFVRGLLKRGCEISARVQTIAVLREQLEAGK